MRTDEDLMELIHDSCRAVTTSVTPPDDWTERIRQGAARRRLAVRAGVSVAAVAALSAAVMAIAVGERPADRSRPAATQPVALVVRTVAAGQPGEAVTCLPGDPSTFIRTWAILSTEPNPVGIVAVVDGGWCQIAAFTPSSRHPATTQTVATPGEPTVYLAPPADGVRLGYLVLGASDAAIFVRGTHATADQAKYLVGEVAAGEPASTLVDQLRTILPSHPIPTRSLAMPVPESS